MPPQHRPPVREQRCQAAAPGPSEEISFLAEPLDEAVRGSQPGAGAAPAARQEEATGFLPWAPDGCLPEPWLQQAPLCQISPALGVWAPRGAGWEVRATSSSWLPWPAATVPTVLPGRNRSPQGTTQPRTLPL